MDKSRQDESYQNAVIDQNHSNEVLSESHRNFQDGGYSDVTLVAGNIRIRTHRAVLSAGSNYFSAMFGPNFMESNMSTIILHEVDGEALQSLVDFAYTGFLRMTEETVQNILCAASYLQFSSAVDACSKFISERINPSNCLGIASFGESIGLSELNKIAIEYTLNNFLNVITCEEYLRLSHNQLEMLLSSDGLNVPSEMVVFDALMKWIDFKKEDRFQHLSGLLSYIKLPLIPPEFLIENVIPKIGSEGEKYIIEALQCHLMPEKRLMIPAEKTAPRKCSLDVVYAIAGVQISVNNGGLVMEVFDPKYDTWIVGHLLPERLTHRLQFGLVSMKSQIFVAGGRCGLRTLNYLDIYDSNTGIWTRGRDMIKHRHGLGLAAVQPYGPLYAIGGHDGWTFLNSVERWDPESGSWTYVAPLLNQRSTCGVCVLNNKIYAVGGRDGSFCLNSVEVYDPHTDKWTNCAPMIRSRAGVAVAVCNGLIYALGGHGDDALHGPTSPKRSYSSYSCVERYNPKINEWTLMARMSFPRDGIGAVVLGNKILAAGGYDGQNYSEVVEIYDTIKNQWITEKTSYLNYRRSGPCVTSVPKL